MGVSPVSEFSGKAICLDIENLNEVNLNNYDYLIIRTDWDRYWNTDFYHYGFPVLSREDIERICKSNLKGIGLDAPSVDPVGSTKFENHLKLLQNNKIIVENLKGLGKLEKREFIFFAMPLKFKGEGSPVRAVAYLECDTPQK